MKKSTLLLGTLVIASTVACRNNTFRAGNPSSGSQTPISTAPTGSNVIDEPSLFNVNVITDPAPVEGLRTVTLIQRTSDNEQSASTNLGDFTAQFASETHTEIANANNEWGDIAKVVRVVFPGGVSYVAFRKIDRYVNIDDEDSSLFDLKVFLLDANLEQDNRATLIEQERLDEWADISIGADGSHPSFAARIKLQEYKDTFGEINGYNLLLRDIAQLVVEQQAPVANVIRLVQPTFDLSQD